MNRKISLLTVVSCGLGLLGEASASTLSQTLVQKPIQFYVGFSGAVEQLSGKRSEELIEPADTVTSFTSNKSYKEKSKAFSAMSGFLWNIPQLPISIGPEVYVGQGDVSSIFRVGYNDPAAGEDRSYSGMIKRKSSYGIMLRGGLRFCEDYLGYVALGADYSNFSVERSMEKDAALPDSHISVVRKNLNFSGFLFGAGLEKRMGNYKIGFDVKGVRYGRKRLADIIPTTNGVPGQTVLNFSTQPKIYSFSLRFSYLF